LSLLRAAGCFGTSLRGKTVSLVGERVACLEHHLSGLLDGDGQDERALGGVQSGSGVLSHESATRFRRRILGHGAVSLLGLLSWGAELCTPTVRLATRADY